MDKSWTKVKNTDFRRFLTGAKEFSKLAEQHTNGEGKSLCPCRRCVNGKFEPPALIFDHIVQYGFDQSYNTWIHHGECPREPAFLRGEQQTSIDQSTDLDDAEGVQEMLHDAFSVDGGNTGNDEHNPGASARNTNPIFERLFADMQKPLFVGCEDFSVLSFLLRLMHIKVSCKMTNVAMDMLLQLLTETFKDANLPKNHYEAKKYLQSLGLGYETIHACENDCALFWKENAHKQECPICGASRWNDDASKTKVPKKVLRYFPVTPRLQRLYGSRHTAKEMRWHAVNKEKDDGVMRHPSDGKE